MICFHRNKLQEKTQENPYFTLNYKENSCFPVFFFLEFFSKTFGQIILQEGSTVGIDFSGAGQQQKGASSITDFFRFLLKLWNSLQRSMAAFLMTRDG